MIFLKKTLSIRQISVINNFSQLLHAKPTLKSHLKALAHSPPWVKSQLTLKGSSNLLDRLKVHKAPGPDGLSVMVLKECSSEIAPSLVYIYNESLAQGNVPDDWRQANVATVFKKGGKYDPANYRPVSLTCICCKTFEHIKVH